MWTKELSMRLILIAAVLLVGLGYAGAKGYLYYKVSQSMESAVLMLSPYMDLEYDGISSTVSGELTINDVKMNMAGYRDEITIGRLGIKTPNILALLRLSDLSSGSSNGKAPEYFGLIAEEIQISADADYYRDIYETNIEAIAPADIGQGGVQCVGKYGFSPRTLKALGYPNLKLSISMIFRQTNNKYITEMGFDIANMMDLYVTVSMAGNMMSGIAQGAAYQPKLSELHMKITDRSLKQRVEKYCTKLGLTPAQILRAHLNALEYMGKTHGIVFDNYLIDPYKQFLAGKPTLIVTAKPREALDFKRISRYKPSDVPALLNLEAVAQ